MRALALPPHRSRIASRPPHGRAPVAAVLVSAALVIGISAASPAHGSSLDDADWGTAVDDVASPDTSQRSPLSPFTADLEVDSVDAGLVSGRVSFQNSLSSPVVPVDQGVIEFFEAATPYSLVFTHVLDDDEGEFSILGLPSGTYRVAFTSYASDEFLPVREWASDAKFYFFGSAITFAEGEPYSFGDVLIQGRDLTVDRVAGPDRFSTAVEISKWRLSFEPPSTVYVVNGLNFPDALSAGAAARDGTLLMVQQNAVPQTTRDELTRLSPDRIVVVGGTAVVSNGVLATLRAYVDDPSDVVRIAGSDRYSTSRAVITSSAGLAGDVDALFIATGANFPDALAAVPAAITENAAVLLVNGSASRLDTATRNLVDDLGVPVYVIGGSGAVSNGIVNQLGDIVATTRFSGADRFVTSVRVAQAFFDRADWAFLANGYGFADALAAGPAAGSLASPVYLVRRECVPDLVYLDIFDIVANEVISVGGSSVISNAARDGLPCGALD